MVFTELNTLSDDEITQLLDEAKRRGADLERNSPLSKVGKNLLQYVPTDEDIVNAASGYSHDFGLLPEGGQMLLRHQAKQWLNAWGHTLPQFRCEGDADCL